MQATLSQLRGDPTVQRAFMFTWVLSGVILALPGLPSWFLLILAALWGTATGGWVITDREQGLLLRSQTLHGGRSGVRGRRLLLASTASVLGSLALGAGHALLAGFLLSGSGLTNSLVSVGLAPAAGLAGTGVGLLLAPVMGPGLALLAHALALGGGLFAYNVSQVQWGIAVPPAALIEALSGDALSWGWRPWIPLTQCLAPFILGIVATARPGPWAESKLAGPLLAAVLIAGALVPPVEIAEETARREGVWHASVISEQYVDQLVSRLDGAEEAGQPVPPVLLNTLGRVGIGETNRVQMLFVADTETLPDRLEWEHGWLETGEVVQNWTIIDKQVWLTTGTFRLERAPWYLHTPRDLQPSGDAEIPQAEGWAVYYEADVSFHALKSFTAMLSGLALAAPVTAWWRGLDAAS